MDAGTYELLIRARLELLPPSSVSNFDYDICDPCVPASGWTNMHVRSLPLLTYCQFESLGGASKLLVVGNFLGAPYEISKGGLVLGRRIFPGEGSLDFAEFCSQNSSLSSIHFYLGEDFARVVSQADFFKDSSDPRLDGAKPYVTLLSPKDAVDRLCDLVLS